MEAYQRKPLASRALCIYVILVHLTESYLLAFNIKVADWIFPMQAFLYIGNGNRLVAALELLFCTLCGAIAFACSRIQFVARIVLFMMQSIPILIVFMWVLSAVIRQRNAFGDPVYPIALILNQSGRLALPILYVVSVRSLINFK